MRTTVPRLVGSLLSACLVALVLSAPAGAQGLLRVDLTESPFVCDGGTRDLGTVDGLAPGERVEFRAPQLGGVFSTREADGAGMIVMRWSCDTVRSWDVTVVGLTSGRSITFTLVGAVAPPPADAPLGAAFDAKSAMTVGEMAIWKDVSPYNGVGIYIPVDERWDNRADKRQVNLTPAWVDAVLADGWRILPIYVGHQAPAACEVGRFENMSNDGEAARSEGRAAGVDAAASSDALGIGPGAPIYLDIEGYRPGCGQVVIAYIEGWTEALRGAGYLSGVYGSQNSVMTDLTAAARRGGYTLPDAIWVSTNSGVAGTLGLEAPPDDLWTNARIHQYRLSVTRTYGGVTLEVDDNIVDGPAAVWRPPIVDSDGDGHGEPEPDNCDGIANPDQADLDGDGDGDVCDRDVDGDGLDDPEPDNCDRIPNPDQADLDGDGDGDVCDRDIDGDFIANDDDPDPFDASVPGRAEPTSEPTAVPATPVPAATQQAAAAEPTTAPAPTATPAPTPEPAVTTPPAAAVIVLPTPAPTATPPPPAPSATATPDPIGALEAAAVTITTEDDDPSPWRAIGIVASATLALAFGGQAIRSRRRGM